MNLITPLTLIDGEAQAIDALMPGNQNMKVGSRLQTLEQRGIYWQRVDVTADATGGKPVVAEVSGELVDATVICTASNASGALTLRRVSTALTTAMACVTVNVMARNALRLLAGATIVQGEALNVLAVGASDRGTMLIGILRT